MRCGHLLITCALLGVAGSCAGGAPAEGPEQQILIVAEEETSTTGVLYRFEDLGGGWQRVGTPVSVVFGRAGVGEKEEGDARSPQGTFDLGTAFGYAASPPPGLRMPYLALSPNSVCVDDPDSPQYNRLLNPAAGVPGGLFSSAEQMRRDLAYGDSLYEFGVVIGYNPDGERYPERGAGRGSCIFLHVWRGLESPTVGCTAMAREDLLVLLAWLDPETGPTVVQGSRGFLEGLVSVGELPYPLPW